jgi:predicted glycosyltransferase
MKLLFFINTPAQVHTWRNIIDILVNKGHHIKVIARDYGITLALLDTYGLPYSVYVRPGKYKTLKSFGLIPHVLGAYHLSKKFNPDIVVGFGVVESLTAALLGKPCIVMVDSESMPVQHLLTKLFASTILTPSSFRNNLGKKQISFPGFKELAYLHPNYFEADPSVYDELGMNKNNDKYVILRFNAFDALHDVGKHGFSVADQYSLVKELGQYARVFIAPEATLPKDLEHYRLPIQPHRIHHALYYAQLLVTDTQSMATEAAVLGTPVVRSNNFVGPNDAGNLIELEQKYDLVYSLRESELALKKALELIKGPDLKEQWALKRQRLLEDKIDVTQFMIDFIENYPESFKKYSERSA